MALSVNNLSSIENEDFRMYHQLQYDRIAQLEQQRLMITNFVIGLSIISFSFAFSDINKLNIINAVGLPIVIIISNIFAMLSPPHTMKKDPTAAFDTGDAPGGTGAAYG